MESNSILERLPVEMLIAIFEHLEGEDLLRSCLVCSPRFNEIIKSSEKCREKIKKAQDDHSKVCWEHNDGSQGTFSYFDNRRERLKHALMSGQSLSTLTYSISGGGSKHRRRKRKMEISKLKSLILELEEKNQDTHHHRLQLYELITAPF